MLTGNNDANLTSNRQGLQNEERRERERERERERVKKMQG